MQPTGCAGIPQEPLRFGEGTEYPADRMQLAQARTTEVWIGLMHCIPCRADVLGFRYRESKGRRSDIGELLEVGVRSCTHPEQGPRNNSQLREKRWIGLRLDKLGEESLITRPCKIARPPTSNHNGPRSSHPLGSPIRAPNPFHPVEVTAPRSDPAVHST